MNGYGAVGDARKRMHPGDAAQHRANLEFSARDRAEERVAELEADLAAARAEVADRDHRLAAVEALAEKWEAADGEPVSGEGLAILSTVNRKGRELRSALGDADTLAARDERVRAETLDEVERLERLIQCAIQVHRDLHAIHANTTACGGGIGGQAITQHCGVTCAYDANHEADNERWYEVEQAFFRRQDGDPEWDRALRTQDGEQ